MSRYNLVSRHLAGMAILVIALGPGVARLEKGYEITVDDLQGTLAKDGVSIHEGDAVILNTGWGSLWMKDKATYGGGALTHST